MWLMVIQAGFVFGCQNDTEAPGDGTPEPAAASTTKGRLVEHAFETASAIPLEPHRKDRARAQSRVVDTCLELGLMDMAIAYSREIRNWRGGVAHGRIAQQLARKGKADQAREQIDLAQESREKQEGWRKDRITVEIARARHLLGDEGAPKEVVEGVGDSDQGKALGLSRVEEDEAFERIYQAIEAGLTPENFDVSRNLLASAVELYGRVYKDVSKRERLEDLVSKSNEKFPIFVILDDHLLAMARHAILHEDSATGLRLANEAKALMDSARWRPEDEIGRRAILARVFYQAGDQAQAQSLCRDALEMYHSSEREIPDYKRAQVLQPLAHTYLEMGRKQEAARLYSQAVEEGSTNPNARARALDLCGNCLSMARSGFQPGDQLWTRLDEIRKGLVAPW